MLKPGGKLFVDVPFFHQLHHAPHGYYRYTPYGLSALSERVGMEIIEIRPSGGYFRTLAHMLEEAHIVMGGSAGGHMLRIVVGLPLKGLGWLLRKLEYLLDLTDQTKGFTCGYHCIFCKPIHRD